MPKDPKSKAQQSAKEQKKQKLRELCTAFSNFVEANRRLPTRADLLDLGYSRNFIRDTAGNLQNLEGEAKKLFPIAFTAIHDSSIVTQEAIDALKLLVKKSCRFVITTAIEGRQVDGRFHEALQQYCKLNKAQLLVLVASDPASSGFSLDGTLDRASIVVADLALNSNFALSTIKLSAKQIDPVTGLQRISQRNQSFAYASPKQRLQYVATGNVTYPHALMTTGSVTLPNYTPNPTLPHAYMSARTAYIATHDHVMGALVVELDKNEKFHFRQIQGDEYGGFADLGEYYRGTKSSKVRALALVLGDWHSGETDDDAKRACKHQASVLEPDEIIIHDGFNGLSINPHERKNIILRARHAGAGKLSLEDELRKFATDLDEISTWAKKRVVVVKSNHDVFLERYLQDAEYVKDPQNHKIAVILAAAMMDGHDPLQYGVELMGLKNKKKIRWLKIDEDYKIAGIQCGAHGHKGPNGAKGSIKGMENSYGASMSGHDHTPGILRRAIKVGTNSKLKLDYNSGPSSWMHTNGVIYPNGGFQLLNSFLGAWTTMYTRNRA